MDLLTKMEVELNNIYKKIKSMPDYGTGPIPKEDRDTLTQLNEAQEKLRKMIARYIEVQSQFLELTGKLSLTY